jgi:hypothetical protein
MASSISFWQVLVSVHSPFWRVFEKNGFPHCSDIKVLNHVLLTLASDHDEQKTKPTHKIFR